MKQVLHITFFLTLTVSLFTISLSSHSSTVEEIIDRDELICGVRGGSFGFGKVNDDGIWSGLDADFCRVLAEMVLKDKESVEFVPLTNNTRLNALKNKDIDVLIRNTTWTYTRDAPVGLEFAGINFYDGQGFLAWKEPGKTKLSDYGANHKICMIKNTTSLVNLKDYLKKNNLSLQIIEFDSTEAADNNFMSRKCHLHSTDRSILAFIKEGGHNFSSSLLLLDEIISKEPLGPVVRDDDIQWQEIVKWALFATIEAEEKGIHSKNIDKIKKESQDPAIRFLLGVDSGVGKPLGLDDDWVYRVIKNIGNYGEIFDRNVGVNSKLKLKRGMNNLWFRGGLMYSPPMR